MKHRKRRVILISVAAVIFLLIAVHFILDTFFPQRNFALESPIVTEQGDQFNYNYTVSGEFIDHYINYKIYHYEGNRWKKVMEKGGECNLGGGITIDKTAYKNHDITIYVVNQSYKSGAGYDYLLVEKSHGNHGIDLSEKIHDAYFSMTNNQIKNDTVLKEAKDFIVNYSLPSENEYLEYKDYFEKIRKAFEES